MLLLITNLGRLGNRSHGRGPTTRRTMARPPSLPLEERHECMPQETAKFGNSKGGCMAEIKMPGHRLGVHRLQTEIRETRVTDSFSVRAD